MAERSSSSTSDTSLSNSSSEPQIQPNHFRTWPMRRSQLSSSQSVSPLTSLHSIRPDYFAQTRATRSFHLSVDEDVPIRPLSRPGLPNRNVTMSSQTTVRAQHRPNLIRGTSMTETAARWAKLTDDCSVQVTKPLEPPIVVLEDSQLSLHAKSIEYQDHVSRRWEHSNRWFKVCIGRERSSSVSKAKSGSNTRTSNSSASHAPPLALEFTPLDNMIPEQIEQESPSFNPEQPLLIKSGHEPQKYKKSRDSWPRESVLHTKKILRFKQVRRLFPLARWKKNDFEPHPTLRRSATLLDKFASVRKSLRRPRRRTENDTYRLKNLGRQETFHSTSQVPNDDPPSENPSVCPFTQWYTSTDNKRYHTVNLSQPNAPAFLPSEATRISTPPLPSSHSNKNPLRGYFFDLGSPDGEPSQTFRPRTKRQKASSRVPRSSTASSDPVWFRVRVEGSEDPELGEGFDPNVPDHLPSSPLCPRHPKHTSGGTGNCFMHGRNRRLSEELEDME